MHREALSEPSKFEASCMQRLVIGNFGVINSGRHSRALDATRRLDYPSRVPSDLDTASSDALLRGWLSCLERAAKRASRSPDVWSSWALVWLGAGLAARRGLVPSPPDPEHAGPAEWLEVARSAPALAGARLLTADFEPGLLDALDHHSRGKCMEAFARLLDADSSVEVLGRAHERLLEWATVGVQRRRSGSFYTPPAVCALIAERALAPFAEAHEPPRVCDPAVGGGAFLLACLRHLAPDAQDGERRMAVVGRLLGVDRSTQALAVAELSIWLELGQAELPIANLPAQLLLGDSLDLDLNPQGNKYGWSWERLLACSAPGGFDLVIGNPPWVAFAGRAAQPLPPDQRKRYAKHFKAWRGYPTLHGLFVELASKLAPNGRVALLLPSPVADLQGYRAVRAVATSSHRLVLPLPELGADAFAGVTQPSFGLLLEPASSGEGSAAPWRLVERQSRSSDASEVSIPDVLGRLAELPALPAGCFGERGFQSAGEISRQLFHRGSEPRGEFVLGLLEGKDVQEFRLGPTRLFLKPDAEVLGRSKTKLRHAAAYEAVDFVVRQTASHPIAALHDGRYFRNTLLAGFAVADFSAELLVGLLNSTLYRALHVAQNRDVRQKVFPQVKIRQLRALPAPPADGMRRRAIEELVLRASAPNGTPARQALLTRRLDEQVFELFGFDTAGQNAVYAFLRRVAPRALASRDSALELSGQIPNEGQQRREQRHHSDPQ